MTAQINPNEYKKRIQKISTLFANMVTHAREQAQFRCPYKNRHNQCSAKFACRNQRPSSSPDTPLTCVADDRFDYRPYWEKENPEQEQA